MKRALPAALAALATLVLTLAACTSSGEDAQVDNPVVTEQSSSSTASSSAPASTTATSSSPPPVTSSARTPSSSTSTVHTPPPPPHSDACTATQLKTELLRGGAELGKQYAAVLFTNAGSRSCTLEGYPYAQLVQGGRLIGKPATHEAGAATVVRLEPGGSAQADLTAVSSCNAALSDHVRVSAPGTSSTVDLPDTLRNCALSIKAVHRA